MVTYAGGTGDSIETAVIIHGAANQMQGVDAEYRYVAQKFGPPGQAWDLENQALLQHEGKHYDLLNIRLEDGTKRAIYFDISAFYGQGTDEVMAMLKDIAEQRQQRSFPHRLLRTVKRLLGSS